MGWFGFGGSSTAPEVVPAPAPAIEEPSEAPSLPVPPPDKSEQKTDSTENIINPVTPEFKLKPVMILPKDATITERFDAWGRSVLPLEDNEHLSKKVIFSLAICTSMHSLYALTRKKYLKMSKHFKSPWITTFHTGMPVVFCCYFMTREWFLPLVLKTNAKEKPYARSFADFFDETLRLYREDKQRKIEAAEQWYLEEKEKRGFMGDTFQTDMNADDNEGK